MYELVDLYTFKFVGIAIASNEGEMNFLSITSRQEPMWYTVEQFRLVVEAMDRISKEAPVDWPLDVHVPQGKTLRCFMHCHIYDLPGGHVLRAVSIQEKESRYFFIRETLCNVTDWEEVMKTGRGFRFEKTELGEFKTALRHAEALGPEP